MRPRTWSLVSPNDFDLALKADIRWPLIPGDDVDDGGELDGEIDTLLSGWLDEAGIPSSSESDSPLILGEADRKGDSKH